MKKHFFISAYDLITNNAITSILNSIPDVRCLSDNTGDLTPKHIEISFAELSNLQQTANNKYTGNVLSIPAFELQHKMLAENVMNQYISAHITLNPIIRLQFILYSWFKTGLAPEKLFEKIHQEFIFEIKNSDGLLKKYNTGFFYQHILNTILNLANNQNHLDNQAKANFTAAVTSPISNLIYIALAIVTSFEAIETQADNQFDLVSILSSENELIRFIRYVTDNLQLTDDMISQLRKKTEEFNQLIATIQSHSLASWQNQLISSYLHQETLDSIYNSSFNSTLVNLISRMRMIDKKRYNLSFPNLIFSDKNYYYHIIHISPFEKILDTKKYLSSEIIQAAKKENVRLLFDLSNEALTYEDDFKNHWLAFHNALEESGISSEKVFLVCSNYHVANHYDKWAELNKINYKVNLIGFNYYQHFFSNEFEKNSLVKNRKQDLINTAKKTIEENIKRKHHFMCLNLKTRIHRTTLLLFFLNRNYMEKGIVTYFGRHSIDPSLDNFAKSDPNVVVQPWKELSDFVNQLPNGSTLLNEFDRLEKMRPILYDKKHEASFMAGCQVIANKDDPFLNQGCLLIPEVEYYGDIKQFDSYFEIITETYFSDETTLYITEKTVRAFLRFQIFIIVGCPFTLRYLRSIGFQTFSPYIDESYDEMTDPVQRMTAILREIDKLCSLSLDELHQLYCELWPRILYNFNHYTTNMRPVRQKEVDELFAMLEQ